VNSLLWARIKQFLKRLIIIALSSTLAVAALTYAVDYAILRYRVSTNNQPFGQVMVSPYDAVAQKNGKTEFIFEPAQAQTCVNALFPHSGFEPCWYLRRHAEPRTDI
jgi:hypothetical protein